MRYAPKTKPIPPPCGRDCPGRAPGCSAMCCSWMLYQSIREHIYQKQLAEKHAQELNFVAQREIAHAGYTGKNYYAVAYRNQSITVRAGDELAAIFTAAKYWVYKWSAPEYHQNAKAMKLHYKPEFLIG